MEEFCIEYYYEKENESIYFLNKYKYMLTKGTFKALLKKEKNETEENYCYSFSILSWTGKEGGFQVLDNVVANVLLTMIEKTMLQIDENTKIKNLYNKYKTD